MAVLSSIATPILAARLSTMMPLTKCKLRLLKLEQIKDYLFMKEEFVTNQERLKPQEKKTEEDRSKVDDLSGSSMNVNNLKELIDENHAIMLSSVAFSLKLAGDDEARNSSFDRLCHHRLCPLHDLFKSVVMKVVVRVG
ncbi:hypothetical protein LOK49_LG06G02735 [Camellia lanceoleosa]|uniref:Uncharacterized protein n=1 Tax=Camellia lanceoleosa TaxID=1840588 RepID=A0ACC0HDA2_9ERIC|nr:hypothetical protein LOK49_LG06G02735 [Camellia lanceoleosa]